MQQRNALNTSYHVARLDWTIARRFCMYLSSVPAICLLWLNRIRQNELLDIGTVAIDKVYCSLKSECEKHKLKERAVPTHTALLPQLFQTVTDRKCENDWTDHASLLEDIICLELYRPFQVAESNLKFYKNENLVLSGCHVVIVCRKNQSRSQETCDKFSFFQPALHRIFGFGWCS